MRRANSSTDYQRTPTGCSRNSHQSYQTSSPCLAQTSSLGSACSVSIRKVKSSRSSFPLSTAFLSAFLRNLGSESDPRLILAQAESHLFLSTPFPKQTQRKQHKPDAPLLTTIAKLPRFDLERVFKPVYAGRLESVHSLLALWMLHKAADRGVEDEAEEEVVMEEQGERQLSYLGKWHAAARD